jgi:hypothetical protein
MEAAFWWFDETPSTTLKIYWETNEARRTVARGRMPNWDHEKLGRPPQSDYRMGPIFVHRPDVRRFLQLELSGLLRPEPIPPRQPLRRGWEALSKPQTSIADPPAPQAPPKTLAQSLAEEFGEDDIPTITLLERVVADMERSGQISPRAKKVKAQFAAAIVKRIEALRKANPELKTRSVSVGHLENHLGVWVLWPR